MKICNFFEISGASVFGYAAVRRTLSPAPSPAVPVEFARLFAAVPRGTNNTKHPSRTPNRIGTRLWLFRTIFLIFRYSNVAIRLFPPFLSLTCRECSSNRAVPGRGLSIRRFFTHSFKNINVFVVLFWTFVSENDFPSIPERMCIDCEPWSVRPYTVIAVLAWNRQ